MDDLVTVVQSLDEDESGDFEQFIQRSKFKSDRKDLRLFLLLREGRDGKSDEVQKLLGLKNLNAYHTLRKRLYAELGSFFLEHEKSEDEKVERILSYLRLSKHLFGRNQNRLAMKFLKKAEKLGVDNQNYKLLHEAYLIEFEFGLELNSRSVSELEELFRSNKAMIEIEERVMLSKAKMTAKVERSKKEGIPFSYLPEVEKEISDSELNEVLVSNPKILLDYLTTLKKSAQVSKSFTGLEKVLETYIKKDKFDSFPCEKIQLNYLLAHTKYRNKKFEESYNLIQESKLLFANCPKIFVREQSYRSKLLICANLVFLGRIEDSIATLKPELSNKHLTIRQRTDLIVILGIYYFLAQNELESLKLLHMLKHSESWYKKEMGVEWVFKKNLMEIILFYDLDRTEIALSRIRSIERRFKEFLEQEPYGRAKKYLSLIRELILGKLDKNQILEKLLLSWKWIPAEEEDLQAMLFYAWLKAKFEKRPFYDVVLSTVNIDA